MNIVAMVQKIVMIPALLLSFSAISAMAQESPVDIHLYLFAMDEMEIRQIMKDGITRDEMDALQTKIFIQNRLLEEEEPVELSVGENEIVIPEEKMNLLSGNNATSTIVLFYHVMPADGAEDIDAGTLTHTSYIVTEKEDKVLEREGTWDYPAEQSSYRYFDFRYANVLGHQDFIYKIEADFGGEPVFYTISIN